MDLTNPAASRQVGSYGAGLNEADPPEKGIAKRKRAAKKIVKPGSRTSFYYPAGPKKIKKKPSKILARPNKFQRNLHRVDEVSGGETKERAAVEDILAEIEKNDKIEQLGEKEKSAEKKEAAAFKKTPPSYTAPVRMYRRIALFFTLATLVILAAALYFSLSKAEIFITPKKFKVNAEFNVTVEKVPLSENGVTGSAAEILTEDSLDYEIEGEGEIKEGIAEGEVIITNETAQNQTLVQTTRLLAEGGVLFHLSDREMVPAYGSVKARIYADKPGETGDIGPTKFTIPGLSAALQRKIYATSDKATSGGKKTLKVASANDISKAKALLKEKIISAAKEQAAGSLNEKTGLVFLSEVTDEKVDAKAGDEKEKINVYMKIKVLAVIYDKEAIKKSADEKIKLVVPAERNLRSVLYDEIKFNLVRYDAESGSAVLKVGVPAETVLKDDVDILNKDNLVGMKKSQAIDYLKNFDEIEDAQIKLRPFFLNRLPSIAERIKIIIQ